MNVPQRSEFESELALLREKEKLFGKFQAESLRKKLYFRSYNDAKKYLGCADRGKEEPFKSEVWIDLSREEVWTVLK